MQANLKHYQYLGRPRWECVLALLQEYRYVYETDTTVTAGPLLLEFSQNECVRVKKKPMGTSHPFPVKELPEYAIRTLFYEEMEYAFIEE